MNELEDTTLKKSEQLSALWTEYRYRHDLVWRILVSAAILVTTLSVVPYTSTEVAQAIGKLILFAPASSAIAVVLSALVMRHEILLMEPVYKKYNKCRENYLGIKQPQNKPKFLRTIPLLLVFGLAVSIGNAVLVSCVWLPYLQKCVS